GFRNGGPIRIPDEITGENREALLVAIATLEGLFPGNDLGNLPTGLLAKLLKTPSPLLPAPEAGHPAPGDPPPPPLRGPRDRHRPPWRERRDGPRPPSAPTARMRAG